MDIFNCWWPNVNASAVPINNIKTWTFSPAVIGKSIHISSVIYVQSSVAKLTDIRLITTCGCIKASARLVPHNPKVIRIDFDYLPHPPEGDTHETLRVVNNQNSNEMLGQIFIEAKVRYAISVFPTVIDLGHILVYQNTPPVLVTVESYSNLPAPKRVSSAPSWLVISKQQWTPK